MKCWSLGPVALMQQEPTVPAYLTTLGIEDWRHEKRLIEREAAGL